MHGVLRSNSARDSLVGTTIDGRYGVLSRIGAGGMGVVYEVEHLLIGRRFALKLMNTEPDYTDELFVRFQREAMAAASIGNPHIVDVTDMGVLEGGGAYLVLEYLEGIDLARRVCEDGPFAIARAVHIALQLCDALIAVHDKRIVHRDLKPENVMLIEREGEPDFVKVLDFGICKLLESSTREAITRTNASLGTPQFMAPEQFRGSARVDARADIHAVGAILYFMLTGAPPYEGDDLPMLLMRICTEAPPSARMLRKDLPIELDHVIKQACAKRAHERYQSAEALRDALLPFALVREATRASGVSTTAKFVGRAESARPPIASPTASSWPAPDGAISISRLPMSPSARALRVSGWLAAFVVVSVLISLLGTRGRGPQAAELRDTKAATQPAASAQPAAQPLPAPAPPIGESTPPPAANEKPRVQAARPRAKQAVLRDEPALVAPPADVPATAPEEAVRAQPPTSERRAADELERFRYPRRELRDEI